LHGAEARGDLGRRRWTILAILLEHPRDEAPQFLRNRRDVGVFETRRRRMKNGVDDGGVRSTLDRAATREHLVEYEPQREDVGPGIQGIAERLLRRHVEDRSHRRAETGERSTALPASR